MIYFIRLSTGTIKIGCTKNFEKRCRNLKLLYGQFEILHTEPGGKREEQQLHERFARLRIRRTEQFHPGSSLLKYLGIQSEIVSQATECPPFNDTKSLSCCHAR